MKKQLVVLLAGALAVTAAVRAVEIVDGVAAIVNDKVITYSDVQDFMRPLLPQLRRTFSGEELSKAIRKAQLDALNTLIERDLILAEFKKKGYNIPETVIDARITEVIANEYNNDRAAFIKSLETQNLTLSQYRDKVRDQVIIQAMANRKKQEQLLVSPYKMEQYYQTHLDEFRILDQIKLRMLLIKRDPTATPAVDSSTNATASTATNTTDSATNATETVAAPVDLRRKLAEEILAKLDAGDSFESLARLYSEGAEAKKGGDWGWVGRDSLRKELNAVAFTLKAGQHSGIIETPDGYYILLVEDVKPSHVRLLPEVRDDIEKILKEEQRAKLQEEWVKQLRAKAYIRMF